MINGTANANTTTMTSSQNIQLAVIITVPLVTLLLVALLLATYCVYYHWNCCKRRMGGADTENPNMFCDEPCPEAIITYG